MKRELEGCNSAMCKTCELKKTMKQPFCKTPNCEAKRKNNYCGCNQLCVKNRSIFGTKK